MLRVCELFTSLQGETSYAGLPCTFVRLAGCNLRCRWCDTPYALTARGRRWDAKALAQRVHKAGTRLAAITGGEPLLQPEAPALAAALARLGHTVLVETNGSLDISSIAAPAVRILDLKAPSSGETDRMDWVNLDRLRPTDEVKILIADRTDYAWACDVLRGHRLNQRCPVLFGAVAGRLRAGRLADWVVADRLPVRVQVQLHRVLWPGRRRRA